MFAEGVALTFSDSEDGGSAVGAYAFDCSLSVLERDVGWVLYLDVGFAFDAVCLWHFYQLSVHWSVVVFETHVERENTHEGRARKEAKI